MLSLSGGDGENKALKQYENMFSLENIFFRKNKHFLNAKKN